VGINNASLPKPMMTHHLKLIGRREEKCSKERALSVEWNSATGRPKPQQKRQRARNRQNRLGTVKLSCMP